MKDNKAIDYPIYGGHDRKDIGTDDIVYDYYAVPQSLLDTYTVSKSLMYAGYGSSKLELDDHKGIYIEGSLDALLSLSGVVDPVLLKFPRYAFSVVLPNFASGTYNSWFEYLSKLVEIDSNAPEPTLAGESIEEVLADILNCTITEEEYNQKLEEIKNSI